MAAYTRQQMLDVLRRTMDEGFLEPILGDPDSAAVVAALADIGARLSRAAEHDCSAGLISLAPPGRPGTSDITVTRTGVSAQTLPRGTLFEDVRGALFFLQQDILVPSGTVTIPLNTASLRKTELVNTVDDPDMRFAPSALVAETTGSGVSPIVVTTTTAHKYATGDLIRITGVVGNTAANGVFTITKTGDFKFSLNSTTGNGAYAGGGLVQRAPLGLIITGATPVQGGASDYLSLLGKERGQLRQAGEQAEDYRARVRNIPDTVSPKAVAAAARGAAQAVGLPDVVLLEPFEDGSDPLLDADLGIGSFGSFFWQVGPTGVLTLTGGIMAFWDDFFFDDTLLAFFDVPITLPVFAGTQTSPLGFAWDDPAAIFLDIHTACAYFKITFQPNADGSTALPGDPDLMRAFWDNFFFDDMPFAFFDVGVASLGGPLAVGGANPTVLSALMALWEEVNRKRASCVRFDVEMVPYKTLVFMGDGQSLVAPTVVFTAAPPAGKRWYVEDIVVGHLPVASNLINPGSTHKVRVTFEDTTFFETALVTKEQQEQFGADHTHILATPALAKRATQVQGFLGTTSTINTRIVVVLRVLEVTV